MRSEKAVTRTLHVRPRKEVRVCGTPAARKVLALNTGKPEDADGTHSEDLTAHSNKLPEFQTGFQLHGPSTVILPECTL